MPEERKTFTAMNLVSVYSLMGKKTILVDFDLLNPKIFTNFGINNDRGVSTWLIGKDGILDIIKETHFENLSIISAGSVPLNLSEELLRLLKERYDMGMVMGTDMGVGMILMTSDPQRN